MFTGLHGTFMITIHGLIRLSLYINVEAAGLKSGRHGIAVKSLLKKYVSAVILVAMAQSQTGLSEGSVADGMLVIKKWSRARPSKCRYETIKRW